MPSPYSGNPAAFQMQRAMVVTGASSATPIRITTSVPHLWNTGDQVVVKGVAGNAAANTTITAPWTISVFDATHFDLVGSVWSSGAFSGNGRAYNLDLNPPLTIPSDTDASPVASVNVAFQGSADRSQFLGLSLPYLKALNVYQVGISDDTWSAWASHALAGGSGWDIVKDTSTPVGDLFAFSAPVPLLNYGDAIEVKWNVGRLASSAVGAMTVAFQASSVAANAWNVGVTSPYCVGDAKHFPASYDGPAQGSSYLRISTPVGLVASVTANSGGKSTLTGLTGMSTASVGDVLNVLGAASAANNGAFVITDYISATSVKVANASGVAGDANNGAIVWYASGMKFNLALYWDDLGGGANSYVLYGHRSMTAIHYRAPQITIPLL